MTFEVLWNQKALDNLKKIDKPIGKKLFAKVIGYLSKDPINLGKPLKNNMSGLWRYRLGDYRVIYTVDLESKTIKAIEAGHRRGIYLRQGKAK